SNLAFPDTGRARVVAVNDAVLGRAGTQRHSTPASGADRQPRQQNRPGRNARRDHPRTPGVELALHLLEDLRLDEARHRNGDHFLSGLALAGARGGLIELPLADVDRVGQDLVDRGNPKGLTTPRAIAM